MSKTNVLEPIRALLKPYRTEQTGSPQEDDVQCLTRLLAEIEDWRAGRPVDHGGQIGGKE